MPPANSMGEVEAEVGATRSISSIWFVPLVAMLVGAWMVYFQWSSQGPLITIAFDNAGGMVPGKTKIKSRSVDIGEVVEIRLNESADGVLVTARMDQSAKPLLVSDSQFWLVSPKISYTGVSGLSTLISGVYIELAPGASSLEYRSYTALSDRPATPEGTPGLYLTLNCDENFAYAKGDPIIYNGLIVGQFESVRFDLTERVVYYSVFIEAPYHELVTENTKFWDATGLRISVGAAGLSVQTGNLATLLTNGLTFGVPAGMPYGAAVAGGSDFDIYPDYEAASEERYQHSVQYVVLVSDTVRGLAVGAPVEYRGILVGKVLSRSIAEEGPEEIYNDGVKIPVLISMQPARVGLTDDELGVRRMNDQMLLWIDKGLKASLKTGSLLTGSLYVDLQHYDELPVSLIAEENGYTVIPTIQDGFSQITAKASQFMDNLNAVDLAQLSENSNGLLKEFRGTAADLRTVAQGLQGLLEHVEDEALVVQVRDTLASLAATSAGFSKGSRNYEQLHDTLAALAATMNELNPLLRRLKSQPNGLIFDSGSDSSLEPKKFTGNNE